MAVAKITTDEPQYGGYEYEFVEEVPEKYNCSLICTKVLREPHLTLCCGKHFCETCLKHWFKKQGRKVCPHCRTENFIHFLNKEKLREINEFKIWCINRKPGCDWKGELSTLKNHLESKKGCGYVEVECTNKCKKRFKRRNLDSHLIQQCPLRIHKCEYCGEENTYIIITEIHYNECQNYPLNCPNDCGATRIKRAEMGEHRNKCPLEPVTCPFQQAGCLTTLVRKNLESHMTTNQQQHLHILMGAFSEMKIMQQVIATDVKILRQSREKVQSDLALASIESQLQMQSFRLKANTPGLTIRMTNFSYYQQSGSVWNSPHFYFDAGYKMKLAVHVKCRTGARVGIDMTITLLLLKGEFDRKLSQSSHSSISVALSKQKRIPGPKKTGDCLNSVTFSVGNLKCIVGSDGEHVVETNMVFIDDQIKQEFQLDDSILFVLSTKLANYMSWYDRFKIWFS